MDNLGQKRTGTFTIDAHRNKKCIANFVVKNRVGYFYALACGRD